MTIDIYALHYYSDKDKLYRQMTIYQKDTQIHISSFLTLYTVVSCHTTSTNTNKLKIVQL